MGNESQRNGSVQIRIHQALGVRSQCGQLNDHWGQTVRPAKGI